MKNVIKFYASVGQKANSVLTAKGEAILKGASPPIWQTPGRVQYYRAENEPFIPDSIKWGVRFPTRYAVREFQLAYKPEVETQINKFLNETIKADYLNGNREINLDLTLAEAQLLYNANDDIKAKAASGELAALHKRCNDLDARIDQGYSAIYDQLDRTLKQVQDAEEEVYSDLRESIPGIRSHQTCKISDLFSFNVNADTAVENYLQVKERAKESRDMQNIATKLRDFISVRADIFEAKAHLLDELIDKITRDDVFLADRRSARQYADAYSQAAEVDGERVEVHSGEAKLFASQIADLNNGELKNLHGLIVEHSAAFGEREKLYSNYCSGDAVEEREQGEDRFRVMLLAHLAGNVFVKDHRLRYQQEQFDRFAASMSFITFRNQNITLRDFAYYYAHLIEELTEDSHGNKCPKIEANYDDFRQKTVQPINATILYYFFSANRSGKLWAQWLLSASKFPNQKIRRAYMRAFS